jgi:hypothetical protein
MAKSIRDIPKKRGRGRPRTTGRGEAIMLRLHRPLLTNLDGWIESQDDKPSRPEAIRRLLERNLPGPPRAPSHGSAHRASEMAANTIEGLTDKSRPASEHARAKRRLIHGPKEFRDIRGDQPKGKA